uniref:Uncharacterized protein n=1 Tax=Kalanchoe fedtschenkoi TaxID=63787 RepID=A0A7N0RD37_KALFE
MGFARDKPAAAAAASSTSPCANLKLAYHNCFNRWYSEKFVKKQWDKPGCADEWEKYRACLSQHLEDKHLSRFLEAGEALFDLSQQTDSGKASGETSS